MAQAQKPDSVFQRNGRVHFYRPGVQFSRVLAFLECGSGETDCSNTGWTVPSQTENCWLPTPIASFPFTSPPVRRRVPPDSVSTLPPAGYSSLLGSDSFPHLFPSVCFFFPTIPTFTYISTFDVFRYGIKRCLSYEC